MFQSATGPVRYEDHIREEIDNMKQGGKCEHGK